MRCHAERAKTSVGMVLCPGLVEKQGTLAQAEHHANTAVLLPAPELTYMSTGHVVLCQADVHLVSESHPVINVLDWMSSIKACNKNKGDNSKVMLAEARVPFVHHIVTCCFGLQLTCCTKILKCQFFLAPFPLVPGKGVKVISANERECPRKTHCVLVWSPLQSTSVSIGCLLFKQV